MFERERERVKGQAFKAQKRRPARSVEWVAHDRMSDGREVNAYLVRAAGLREYFRIGNSALRLRGA